MIPCRVPNVILIRADKVEGSVGGSLIHTYYIWIPRGAPNFVSIKVDKIEEAVGAFLMHIIAKPNGRNIM